MSTSVPPHNLGETIDALIYMLNSWESLDEIGVADLMQFIKGPDFPTGGVMFRYDDSGNDRIANAYATGRGKVTLQANAHVVQLSGNRSRIIITELPYQTNKTNLIERIATLVRDERIEGITDLRDESDRQGMRIVLDMTRNVDPYDVLAALYKLTPMRQTFSVIMLALVEGEPRLLSLKQALRVFLDHRLHIVKRRSEYDLARAKERAHILEGLLIALDNLDEVISIIRKSRSAETAHTNLMRSFKLSEEQATAILNMPLRRLAALEAKRIEQEYKEKQKLIELLTRMLGSPQMMRGAIKEELTELRELYADARRTLVVAGAAGDAVSVADLMPDEESWIVITEGGRISRTFDDVMPRVTQKVKDPPRVMLLAGASDTLYVFASNGEAATVPVHQITQVQDFEVGAPVAAVTPLDPDHEVIAALSVPPGDFPGYLTMGSEQGMIKRVVSEDLPGLTAKPFEVMTIGDDDRMGWALWTLGGEEVIMVTAQGKAICFDEEEVRSMGLRAGGVRGVKLADDSDRVVGMMVSDPGKAIWVITNTGLAKSSLIEEYPVQGRYGQGVITIKMGDPNAEVAAAAIGSANDTLTVVTSRAKPKYMSFGLAPQGRRNMTGESVIALGESESVSYVVTAQMRISSNDTDELEAEVEVIEEEDLDLE
jgi:DNA gyrase subunit A